VNRRRAFASDGGPFNEANPTASRCKTSPKSGLPRLPPHHKACAQSSTHFMFSGSPKGYSGGRRAKLKLSESPRRLSLPPPDCRRHPPLHRRAQPRVLHQRPPQPERCREGPLPGRDSRHRGLDDAQPVLPQTRRRRRHPEAELAHPGGAVSAPAGVNLTASLGSANHGPWPLWSPTRNASRRPGTAVARR
jgi:hypothetical protein